VRVSVLCLLCFSALFVQALDDILFVCFEASSILHGVMGRDLLLRDQSHHRDTCDPHFLHPLGIPLLPVTGKLPRLYSLHRLLPVDSPPQPTSIPGEGHWHHT
jgi:hypothetical protein